MSTTNTSISSTEQEESMKNGLEKEANNDAWTDTFSTLDPTAFLSTFLEKDVRPDGRLFHRARETTVVRGVTTRNAAGSSLVCIGRTQVMACVALLVGTPAAEHPSCGDVLVHSPLYSTWLQRVLRDSRLVDLSALVLQTARAAWRLQISILVLNDDGNVKDGMLLAAIASLKDTKLPNTIIDKQGRVHIVSNNEDDDDYDDCGDGGCCAPTPLLGCLEAADDAQPQFPIPLTVGLVHDVVNERTIVLVDPTLVEQDLVDSTCTIVMNAVTSDIVNVDLRGRTTMSLQQLALIVQMTKGRAHEVVKLLE